MGHQEKKKLINIGLRGAQNCFVVNTEEAEYFLRYWLNVNR